MLKNRSIPEPADPADLSRRNFVTERTPAMAITVCSDPRVRCRCTIDLDDVRYRCARRQEHSGAHDANDVHRRDGGLVRW